MLRSFSLKFRKSKHLSNLDMILEFTQKLTWCWMLIDDDQTCELWKAGEQLITSFSSTKYKAGWSAPGSHWTRHPHYNIGLSCTIGHWSRFVYLSCQHKDNFDWAVCCTNLCRSLTSVKYRSSWETHCTGEGVLINFKIKIFVFIWTMAQCILRDIL